MFPPMALGDVVVGFQNRNCLPVLVAAQRPAAGHHHNASIRLDVFELAIPAPGAQQLSTDVLEGCREDRLEQTVSSNLADHFPRPPTVEFLGSAVPECYDVAHVTHANGIMRKIEQAGLLSSFSYFLF